MMVANPCHAERLYVCRNMREKSREEIFSVREGDADDVANELRHAGGFQWVGYHNGMPAALIGAYPLHNGVWGLFGFGTEDWRHIWRAVTVTAKRDMMLAVLETGAHRAHCITLADHEDTHKWLRFLGARHETEMPKYGKNGEDYRMFAWLRED